MSAESARNATGSARELPDGGIVLSVVCAVFNGSATLAELLDSYAAQWRGDVELIVMDGGSTDNTLEVVRNSAVVDQFRSERDRGIYDAWNKALPLCRGTHVAFIGADDVLADGALNHLVRACRSAASDVNMIAGFNVLTRERTPVQLLGQAFAPGRLVSRMQVAHVMSAHAINWIRSAGGFDASYRSAGDYELLLRSRRSLKVVTLPCILAYMEDGGTSRRRWLPHLESYRARRKNGISLLQSMLLFTKACAGILFRTLRLR